MGQTVAEVVGITAGKDLRLRLQAPEGAGMDDAVPVPLKIIAIGMLGLGKTTSARLLHPHGVVGQHRRSLALLETRPGPLGRCALGPRAFELAQLAPVGRAREAENRGEAQLAQNYSSFSRISLVGSKPRDS